jgi:ribosomal protein S18 acetylase RimI-like enzyme
LELVIRPATLEDYDGVALVFGEVELLHRQALPYIFRATDGPALSREYYQSVLSDPETAWLVAEQASEIVGFVTLRILYAPDRPMLAPRRYAEVECLGVQPRRDRVL